jgi:hypothetical protein
MCNTLFFFLQVGVGEAKKSLRERDREKRDEKKRSR